MRPHVHTGFIAFLFAGVSAVVFINGLRFVAAHMVESDRFAGAGKTLGSLVTFE